MNREELLYRLNELKLALAEYKNLIHYIDIINEAIKEIKKPEITTQATLDEFTPLDGKSINITINAESFFVGEKALCELLSPPVDN